MTHYLVRAQQRQAKRRTELAAIERDELEHALALFGSDEWADDEDPDDADGRAFQWWTTGGSTLG